MATQQAIDEAEIRRQLDILFEAIRAADLERLKPLFTAEIVSFDVGPRLQDVGATAKSHNWEEAFRFFQHPLGYEVRDLTITVGGDVAFAHSFNRLSGTLKNGNTAGGFWVRATYGFQRIDGHWRIAHDHVSVPLDPGSGKPVLDLEP